MHAPTLTRMAAWLVLAATPVAMAQSAPTPSPWPVAGQQGLVRYVIVPAEQARDEAAYARQLALLCEPERTCFVNFYTNSTGAPLGVPLPDAIEHEATAVFRQSVKRGAATLRWSCRMQIAPETCF